MKKLKVISIFASFVMLTCAFAGCTKENISTSSNSASVSTETKSTITVTDGTGRNVTLPAAATRVIALQPSDCEIIFALGAGDAIIGRGEYCDYPAEVLDIPSVASGMETNVEQILALEPQVIFMNTMNQQVEQIEQFEKAGIAVVVNEPTDLDSIYSYINLIGTCLGKDTEATSLVTNMKDTFANLQAQIPQSDPAKTVYFETSPLEYGLWTAGSTSFMTEIGTLLGLENIFADIDSSWAEVSQEQIIERNPDYIISITMYYGEGTPPEEEIMSREGWQNITAVAEEHVFLLNADEISRPGPRLADAATDLFNLVYSNDAVDTSSAA